MPLHFTWDLRKARANRRKHRVSFEEAAAVFADPLARILDDPEHSVDESREIVVGQSGTGRLLLVSFTEREREIRLISARKATKREREDYANR